MKLNIACALIACAMFVGGCASADKAGGDVATAAPAAAASASAAADVTNPVVPADVQAALKDTKRNLIAKLNRVASPSKSKPKVYKSGKNYVAKYVEISQDSAQIVALVMGSGKAPYLACIQYREDTKMCVGPNKAKAIDGTDCTVSSEYRKEMLHYDGRKWNY